jgi:hypothetical protein
MQQTAKRHKYQQQLHQQTSRHARQQATHPAADTLSNTLTQQASQPAGTHNSRLTQQVDGKVVLEEVDVGVGSRGGHQGALNLCAGGICRQAGASRRGGQEQGSRSGEGRNEGEKGMMVLYMQGACGTIGGNHR